MPDFMKMGSTLFSALCAKFAVNVFFSPETISKVDDIKTKGNVFFFSPSLYLLFDLLTLSHCFIFFFFFSFLDPLLSLLKPQMYIAKETGETFL